VKTVKFIAQLRIF